jgi:hypothetical protein
MNAAQVDTPNLTQRQDVGATGSDRSSEMPALRTEFVMLHIEFRKLTRRVLRDLTIRFGIMMVLFVAITLGGWQFILTHP